MFGLQLGFSNRVQRKGSCSRSWRLCELIFVGTQLARCTYICFGAVQTIELTLHRMLHPCVQPEQIMGSYLLLVIASS